MVQNIASCFRPNGTNSFGLGNVFVSSPDHLMGLSEPPKITHAIPDFPWQKTTLDTPIGRSMLFLKDVHETIKSALFDQFVRYDDIRLSNPLADIDSLTQTFKDVKGASHSALTLLYFAGTLYYQSIATKRRWHEDECENEALEEEAEKALESGDKDALTKVVARVISSEFSSKKKNRKVDSVNEDIKKYVTKIVMTENGKYIPYAVKAIVANFLKNFTKIYLKDVICVPNRSVYDIGLLETPDFVLMETVEALDKEFGILNDPLQTVLFITNIRSEIIARITNDLTIRNDAIPDAIRTKVALQYIFSILW